MQTNATPQVLRWARETAGHTFESTAKALRRKTVLPEVVQAWEGGEAKPTYAQLKRLGVIFQRPIALFFFPEPPDDSELSPNEAFDCPFCGREIECQCFKE